MKNKWIIASILIVALIVICGASLYATWVGVRMAQSSGVHISLGAQNVSAQATEEKTLAVSGPADLDVANDFGDISVQAGADEQISVKAEKTAWGGNEADAQAALKDIKVVYDQTGNKNQDYSRAGDRSQYAFNPAARRQRQVHHYGSKRLRSNPEFIQRRSLPDRDERGKPPAN